MSDNETDMAIRRTKAKPRRAATALHAQTENGTDVVMIDKLRVALMQDGSTWVAQGLEIDYAAEGSSLDEAKTAFARGLMLTLRENVRVFGNIRNVLRVAPPEVWNAYMAANVLRQIHSQISEHSVRQMWRSISATEAPRPAPPIGRIDYYLQQQAVLR